MAEYTFYRDGIAVASKTFKVPMTEKGKKGSNVWERVGSDVEKLNDDWDKQTNPMSGVMEWTGEAEKTLDDGQKITTAGKWTLK